jgi:hypothetical protein
MPVSPCPPPANIMMEDCGPGGFCQLSHQSLSWKGSLHVGKGAGVRK